MPVKSFLPQTGQTMSCSAMKLSSFGVGPAVAGLRALGEVLDELVRAEARLAGLAVHQRVVEAAHMAGGHPDLAVHQNRAVQARVIGGFLNEFLPPRALDVVLELHAEGAEIPRIRQTAVDFGAGKDKAAVLAERNQFVHRKFRHDSTLLCSYFTY